MVDYQFTGSADIYLQGSDALEPTYASASLMAYYVGDASSKILVRDHRQDAVMAARTALIDPDNGNFADIFSRPAWVEIRSRGDQTEIEIFDYGANTDSPILWLGVIHDGKMTVNEIDWEVLKPVGQSKVAFAALVRG